MSYIEKKFTVLLYIASPICIIADEYDAVDNLKTLYISTFPDASAFDKDNKDEKEKDSDIVNVTPEKLSDRHIRELVYSNIINDKWIIDDPVEDIYNKYAIKDLKISAGTTDNPKYNLITRINHTKTVVGELTLSMILAHPTDNINELQRRQNIIKNLQGYSEERDTLDKILEFYKSIENNIMSIYSDVDPLFNKINYNIISDLFLFSNPRSNTIKNLDMYKVFVCDIWCIWTPFLYSQMVFASVISNKSVGLYGLFTGFRLMSKSFCIYSICLGFGLGVLFDHMALSHYRKYSKIEHNIIDRLCDISQLLRISNKLYDVFHSNEELKTVLGDKIMYMKTVRDKVNADPTLKQIFKFLWDDKKKIFNWNYMRSNAGKLFFTYEHLQEFLSVISGVIKEIGLIDAYISCSKLMNESKEHENKYVWAEYLNHDDYDTPYLKINKMWNPFLDHDKAVTNFIEMGKTSKTGCTNIILTGPNAGGKSTFLTGIVLSIILSQTIGMAPVESITLTPFSKINTYIDVSDDINAGKSLFVAEVDRGYYQYQRIKNLSENQFSFDVYDEMFTGTNPYEGAAAGYSIMEALAKYPNTMSIIATHYPIMMLLEEKNYDLGFRNYKVYISRDKKGNIVYSFKVIPGKSVQVIVIDVLRERGYKSNILDKVKFIIEHPEQFQTKFLENKIEMGLR